MISIFIRCLLIWRSSSFSIFSIVSFFAFVCYLVHLSFPYICNCFAMLFLSIIAASSPYLSLARQGVFE